MAKKTFTLRSNADGTITFRYDRYVEHFERKGPFDTYENIKWAAISAGINLDEHTLTQLYQELINA
jgi:hypothetical protein